MPYADLDNIPDSHCIFELIVGMHSDGPGLPRFPKYTRWGTAVVLPKRAKIIQIADPSYFKNALKQGGLELGIRSTKWVTFSLDGYNYAVISVHCSNNKKKREIMIPSLFADGQAYANYGYNVIIAGDFNTTPIEWIEAGYDRKKFQTDISTFDTSERRPISHINPDGSFSDRLDYIFTCFQNGMQRESEEIRGIDDQRIPRMERTFGSGMKRQGHDHAIVVQTHSKWTPSKVYSPLN